MSAPVVQRKEYKENKTHPSQQPVVSPYSSNSVSAVPSSSSYTPSTQNSSQAVRTALQHLSSSAHNPRSNGPFTSSTPPLSVAQGGGNKIKKCPSYRNIRVFSSSSLAPVVPTPKKPKIKIEPNSLGEKDPKMGIAVNKERDRACNEAIKKLQNSSYSDCLVASSKEEAAKLNPSKPCKIVVATPEERATLEVQFSALAEKSIVENNLELSILNLEKALEYYEKRNFAESFASIFEAYRHLDQAYTGCYDSSIYQNHLQAVAKRCNRTFGGVLAIYEKESKAQTSRELEWIAAILDITASPESEHCLTLTSLYLRKSRQDFIEKKPDKGIENLHEAFKMYEKAKATSTVGDKEELENTLAILKDEVLNACKKLLHNRVTSRSILSLESSISMLPPSSLTANCYLLIYKDFITQVKDNFYNSQHVEAIYNLSRAIYFSDLFSSCNLDTEQFRRIKKDMRTEYTTLFAQLKELIKPLKLTPGSQAVLSRLFERFTPSKKD